MELRPIEQNEWQDFLRRNSEGALFHRWEWQDIIEKGFGFKVSRLGIFDAQNRLCGLLPLVERKIGLLKLAGSPLTGAATPQSGPLGDVPLAEVLQALDRYAWVKRIDYLELAVPDLAGQETLQQNGFTVKELLTLEILLPETEEKMWGKLEVRCRNAVRKAQKSGVEVFEPQALEEWLEPYYELSRGVYLRQGKEPPFSKEYFTALWQNLYAQGDLTVLLARCEGKTVAGAIFPKDRNSAYYLDGVSDREYSKAAPNNLIQWEFLRRALQSGVSLYDMVGANIPSIASFKRSFGSTERVYLYAYKSRTWLARLGRSVYAGYGQQIKRLLKH